MNFHDRSEKRARLILNSFVNTVTNEFSKHICSIILVGSLSNGSYIEGLGRDIDQITILNDGAPETIRQSLLSRINEIKLFFNNDIAIAKSVYKYSEVHRPFLTNIRSCMEDKYLLEVPTELFRIHESGILLYGKDITTELPVPRRDEVILFDEIGRTWNAEIFKKMPYQNTQEELPARLIVQSILTTAFKHYYYATEKSCSNKHEVANRIRNEVKNYRFQELLDLATELKINPQIEFINDKTQQLRSEYYEFQDWVKNNPVYAVPLR